ncbi:protein transport protein SEC16B homolog, partial [Curcuma longa]|uniref:protein transport protein SEC16B homolog n=1 Tax=Curcuma longa TaxID=136217 RepID=UPI003D9E12A6
MESPPFHVEDQTDEDFFNNLVDDDFGGAGSHRRPNEIVRDLSNLSLDDDIGTSVEDPDDAGLVFESNGLQQGEAFQSSDPLNDPLASANCPPLDSSLDQVAPLESSVVSSSVIEPQSSLSTQHSGSKGTSVKEIQWSAFSVSSQPFDNVGLESYSDFFAENVDSSSDRLKSNADLNFSPVENQVENLDAHTNSLTLQDSQLLSSATDQNTSIDAQYWESLYPGWKYDATTGQWYQLDGYDAGTNAQNQHDSSRLDSQGNFMDSAEGPAFNSNLGTSDNLYLQQTSQSVLETIAEETATATNATTTNWNIGYKENTEFPPNMVFDPQYPGWYYDTNTQNWYSLESYTTPILTEVRNEVVASNGFSSGNYSVYNQVGQTEQNSKGTMDSQEFVQHWAPLSSSYSHQQNTLQAGGLSGKQEVHSFYNPNIPTGTEAESSVGIQMFKPIVNHDFGSSNGIMSPHNSVNGESRYPTYSQNMPHSIQKSMPSSFLGNQNSVDYSQHSFQDTKASYSQFTYSSSEGRSSAGCPAHALVAFGFGGKLLVVKNATSFDANINYGSQGTPAAVISILSLSEVVTNKLDASSIGSSTAWDYFHSLCHQNFPGPLVGGSASTKDINKWLDERISSYDAPVMEFQKGKLLKLLVSLLKISLQNYGKLRSPFGSDPSQEDVNGPEMEVCNLFASSKISSAPLGGYGSYDYCLNNIPSESQLQATAAMVQSLLVSGKRREALQFAQEGQLWGPALVLAAQFGDKFYVDTVRKMAQHQLAFGSPLRSLCLLIAGQPADVFLPMENAVNSLPLASPMQPAKVQPSGMLDKWEENLAIITANRTKDDELVIIHLGDCLWKDRGEVTAAHTCYLVAEANIEPYTEIARLCLIGADHLRYPRTYATPDAIQ